MAADNICNLNETNFDAEVLQADKPVLVDFWAEWCGPCKMIAPIIDELAAEMKDSAKFGKVDIDSQQSLAAKYNIRSIPTLLIFKNGVVVDQIVGLRDKSDLKDSLTKAAG